MQFRFDQNYGLFCVHTQTYIMCQTLVNFERGLDIKQDRLNQVAAAQFLVL